MQHCTTPRIARGAFVGLATLLVAACGDARLDQLSTGISRDSALKVINEGVAGDSLARVYKQETYLYKGQLINVLFYNQAGIKQDDDSSLVAKKQKPIVTVNGKVTGWGWTYYDSVAKANNIQQTQHP